MIPRTGTTEPIIPYSYFAGFFGVGWSPPVPAEEQVPV